MHQAGVSTLGAGRCTPIAIDLLAPEDWRELRSTRLTALEDSPGAFITTLADEESKTPAEWIACIHWSTWAVARDRHEVVGVACLAATSPLASEECVKEYFIESVWVTPVYRRRGLGRRMLQTLEGQARADGAGRLLLWVLDTNDSAYDTYLKLDFYPVSDRVQDSPKPRADTDNFVQERLMIKPLV